MKLDITVERITSRRVCVECHVKTGEVVKETQYSHEWFQFKIMRFKRELKIQWWVTSLCSLCIVRLKTRLDSDKNYTNRANFNIEIHIIKKSGQNRE